MTLAAAALAMTAVSAFAQIKQGQAQGAQLDTKGNALTQQAKFVRLKGRQDSLKFKRDAVIQLQGILENLARVTAVAGAGNVDAFSGSAVGAKNKNLNVGGLNVLQAKDNAFMTIGFANAQAQQMDFQAGQLHQAASGARSNGITSALFTIGMGMFQFAQLGGFGGSPTGLSGAGGTGASTGAGGFGGNVGGGFPTIPTSGGGFGVQPPISPSAVPGYSVTTFGA
jgi:hypothetical protein